VLEVLQGCFEPAARFKSLAVEAWRARVDREAWRLDAPARTELFSVAVSE
jgi:hypothetical protein